MKVTISLEYEGGDEQENELIATANSEESAVEEIHALFRKLDKLEAEGELRSKED